MSQAQCSNCRFFFIEGPLQTGECRRYAPPGGGSGDCWWKSVRVKDWCGEWEEGVRLVRTDTDYEPTVIKYRAKG